MVYRQVFTGGLLVGILCFAIAGLRYAAPISGEAASLAIRNSEGTDVAE